MTRSPYRIDGPAQICFSGGRSSAFMLYHILQANNGLPEDVFVTFQNTGKELEATLEFIAECARRWAVPIHWIEWDGFVPPGRGESLYRDVTFETASRQGEPFAALTSALGYLPNPTQRVCTAYLKVKTGQAFMQARGYEQWDNVMGIRADEPSRIAKMMNPGRDNRGGIPLLPMSRAGVSKRDVGRFWKAQPFDLKLQNNNGVTPEGNCDLCFLKAAKQVHSLIQREPGRAIWWIAEENKTGATFRMDRPSYRQMHQNALDQSRMFSYEDESLIDCMCGD